jgi:hypothetical protein
VLIERDTTFLHFADRLALFLRQTEGIVVLPDDSSVPAAVVHLARRRIEGVEGVRPALGMASVLANQRVLMV